jgi:hypothetical protein
MAKQNRVNKPERKSLRDRIADKKAPKGKETPATETTATAPVTNDEPEMSEEQHQTIVDANTAPLAPETPVAAATPAAPVPASGAPIGVDVADSDGLVSIVLRKRITEKGGLTSYARPGVRASVYLTKNVFKGGVLPETITFRAPAGVFAEPGEVKVVVTDPEKAKKVLEAAAKAEAAAKKALERAAKAQAKANAAKAKATEPAPEPTAQ